jgi:ubiquinone/menaquinone biosynthesis C-methylase UbiE
MNDWFKEISVCPACRSSLDWENLSPEVSQLKGLFFVGCTQCKEKYPLWLERPILISKHRLKRWSPPIYEALHLKDSKKHSTYESEAWLSAMIRQRGLEECLSWIEQDWENDQEPGDWYTELKKIEPDAELRKSGRWFTENNQVHRMLEGPIAPMPSQAEQRSLLDEFVYTTLQAHPRRLLDIASGGGFNLSRTLGVDAEVQFAVGTDRELKCLWTHAYRLAYMGKGDVSEVVGADVHQLPFADEIFDYATTWQSLKEICGIERMLREVFRVLTPGGRFQVSYKRSSKIGQYDEADLGMISKLLAEHRELNRSEIESIMANLRSMSRRDYEQFARVADLFIDEEDFLARAEQTGFRIKHVVHHLDGTVDNFITVLHKPPS